MRRDRNRRRLERWGRIGTDPETIPIPSPLGVYLTATALFFVAAFPVDVRAESARGEAAEGVRLFKTDDLEGAAEAFGRAAALDPAEPTIQYNLGTTKLLLQDHEAADLHLREGTHARQPGTKRDAWYNLGVSKLEQAEAALTKGGTATTEAAIGRLEEGLEGFRNALIQDPRDKDAAHNFEYALRLIRELKDAPQNQSQDGQNQEEGDSDPQGQPNNQKPETGGDDRQGDEKQGEHSQGGSSDQPGEQDESQEGADPNEGQRGGLEATPTPSPEDAPASGQKTRDEEPGTAPPSGGGGQGRPEDRPPTSEELDALRVLNSLEQDKPEQFKRLFRFGGRRKSERLERDW